MIPTADDLSRAEMTPERKDNEKTSHMPKQMLNILFQFGHTSFLNLLRYKTQMQQDVTDGAYYCYCAYVLRISRYSDFLSVMPTNTGIFLRGLKLSGESRS